jgi:hypothetical protein
MLYRGPMQSGRLLARLFAVRSARLTGTAQAMGWRTAPASGTQQSTLPTRPPQPSLDRAAPPDLESLHDNAVGSPIRRLSTFNSGPGVRHDTWPASRVFV